MKTVRYRKPYTLFSRSGVWYYRLWENGKRIAKSTGLTSKVMARSYCDELLKLNKLGKKHYLLGEYAKDFFSPGSIWYEDKGKELARKTLVSYEASLRLHILPYLGSESLSAINYSIVKGFKIKLLEQKSKATVRLVLCTSKIIFDYALRDGLIDTNPFDLLEGITSPYKNRDSFTRIELKDLIAKAPTDDFKKYIALLALSGMRIGEAYGVTQEDVTENQGFKCIYLTRQLQNGEYIQLKTKKPRYVPLCDELISFIGSGSNVHYQILVKYVRRMAISYDLEGTRKLTVHSLRHFFVTDAKSHGVNALKVETIVGHSIKGIEGVYTNFKPEDLKDIIQWQEELLTYIFE